MATRREREVRNSIGGATKVFAESRNTANQDGNVRLGLEAAGAEHAALNLTRREAAVMYAVLARRVRPGIYPQLDQQCGRAGTRPGRVGPEPCP